MSIFNWMFRRKPQRDILPMPSWNIIIEMMYDKHLDAFADEVIDVMYSRDHSMRYVILKGDNDLLTYQLEAIYQFDEDEWKYICSHDHALPAMWEPFRGIVRKSFFESIEELRKEMESEPEYKQYF